MYEGSMVGAGAIVFAVWGYAIAHAVPDKKVGTQVRLNAKLIGPILGEQVEAVEKAIEFLCAEDPDSTTKTKDGRRLVKIGTFDYQMVNGAKYRAIRDEEERRQQNREAKRRERLKKQLPMGGEITNQSLYEKGLIDEHGNPIPPKPPEEEPPTDENDGCPL